MLEGNGHKVAEARYRPYGEGALYRTTRLCYSVRGDTQYLVNRPKSEQEWEGGSWDLDDLVGYRWYYYDGNAS